MYDLNKYTVKNSSSIHSAMKVIDKNAMGFCFIIDENGKLVGVLTDGDIRRALLRLGNIDIAVGVICNTNFEFGKTSDRYENLIRRLTKKIRFLPIVNEDDQLVNFLTERDGDFIPILEPSLGTEELNNVIDCMKSGWISSAGKYVEKFETDFKTLHDGRYTLAVSNGTVALHLALTTLGIGPGDEVIVPSLTFAASAAAIVQAGAIPVFCECDDQLCISPKEIKMLITSRTKAIMVVHLYGRVAEVDEIMNIAHENDLLVIEDTAEALGSTFNNRLAGTFGDAATFSFFGNKTITTGEGGMILFKNEKHHDRARVLRDHGMSKTKRYWHEFVGFNYRMTNLQAAIGVAQLAKLPEILLKKRTIMETYSKYFMDNDFVQYCSKERVGEKNSNWLYTVIFSNKLNAAKIADGLNKKQIDTRPVFYPLHTMPPYTKYTCSKNMTKTLSASNNGICLPSAATLQLPDIDRIITVINETIKKQQKFG